MSFLKDFKGFAIKGNMFDLAVGVVIGGAFGRIINSLVADLIMPPFGFLLSGVDFKKLKWVMKPAVTDATGTVVTPEVAMTYGNAIQITIEFFIIAFCIFLFVQLVHKMRKKQEDEQAALPPPPPGEEIILLREIRDSLKQQGKTL